MRYIKGRGKRVGELYISPLLCLFHSTESLFSQQPIKYSFLCLNKSFHASSALNARHRHGGLKLNKGKRIFSVTASWHSA